MKIPLISDIKRFSVHDGDGIRTTVFFKGCSLKCVWCHNPESLDKKSQIAYFADKCINCGECTFVCKNNAHLMLNDEHFLNHELCSSCGICEDVCLGNAIKIYGKSYSVDELVEILLKDKDFYENSGGGVTFSGGECLLYPEYCCEIAKKLKEYNVHVAIDTCGFVKKDAFDIVAPYTDLFLYDIKAIDSAVHVKCTGKDNDIILNNLRYIDNLNIPIYIRIPYVPDFNDCEIDKIAEFIKPFININRVEVLAYHNYASSRYNALNIKNTLPKTLPTDVEVEVAQSKFIIK